MSTNSESLAQAVVFHQAGQLPQAERIYRQVLQADPGNADAWHLLGVIGSQVNQHEAAIDYIRRAIELNPNSTAFHANLGAVYQKLKRFDQAVACYRRALELNPNNADAHNNLGVAFQSQGDLVTAEACFRRALTHNANYAEAHCNLGNVLHAQGKPEEALGCHQRAVQLKPGHAEAHHGIGAALKKLGRADEAIAAFRLALELKPDSPDTHNDLGVALKDHNQLDEAIAAYRRALELKPDYVEAHTNLGNALREQGRLDEAIACHQRALELKPDFPEALNNLGLVFKEQGKLEEAIACHRRAVELKPDFAEAHNSLGLVLKEQGRLDEAITCFRRALELKPNFTEAHNSLGIGMQVQGRMADAMSCFQRALQLQPDNADAHNNLGNVLKDAAQFTAAIAYYRRALQLKPDLAEAHNNLGNALKDQGQVEEALPSYRRSLEIKPEFADVRSNMIFSLNYRPGVTLAELAEAHAEFDRRHVVPLKGHWPAHAPRGRTSHRLRLGFLSPDFCQHPVGFFLIRALENLDRSEVDVVCYNDRAGKDHFTSRFQAAASLWRDVLGWSHEQLAASIRDDQIDILFDLAGHTAHNRMLTFARKPAPVEVTWIGYEGTTGLSAMDYLLADRYMVPPEAEPCYREKILRMPDSYICFNPPEDAAEVSPLPALRTGQVTFASCNNLAKINGEVVALWAEVLRRVPGARLMLKYRGLEDEVLRARYLALFAAQGITANRLQIEGWSPLAELLARHEAIDVALDPFPFTGGVTTCNGLWMGVPVVTWPGETFASRHALSFLSTVGLTETIAGSRAEYVEIAARLAGNLPRLAAIRAGLRQQVAASPLCDGKRFAADLLAVLREAWQRSCDMGTSSISAPGGDGIGAVKPRGGEARPGQAAAVPAAVKTVLHVGCGQYHAEGLAPQFGTAGWKEIRLDIDPSVSPDVVASITDMAAVASNAVDAVWSSHNLEHLYAHEVPLALREFWRVLKPGGLALLTMPDVQAVARRVAQGDLDETLYVSPAGPICAVNILFGHRRSIAGGNHFMAHKTGFTPKSLAAKLREAGFADVKVDVDPANFSLWAWATK